MKKALIVSCLLLYICTMAWGEMPVDRPGGISPADTPIGLEVVSLNAEVSSIPTKSSGADMYGPNPAESTASSEYSAENPFDFEENCVIEYPEVACPGDMLAFDCVITSQNFDPLGVKIQFGQGEQVYLSQVTENPKHWRGEFRFPSRLPEGEYTASLKLLLPQQVIVEKQLTISAKRKVAQVIITGNTLVSGDRILEAIRVTPGEYYTPLKVQSDLMRINSTGVIYFATADIRENASGQLVVKYTVQENPVIDEIDISGNTVYVDYTIINKMQTKVGEILDNEKLRADIKMIDDMYQESDYVLNKVKAVIKPAPGDPKQQLVIVVGEVRVGKIAIKGNKSTKDKTILRELEMKPGMVFDRDMLQSDLRNVFNLNYFKNVYPNIKPSLLSEDFVDLDINVEEKKTNSINFGGGYGQLDGWFGFVDLFLDNLWGEGKSALLKAQFGELRTSYQLRYYDPWAFPDHTSFAGKIWSTYGYSYLNNYIEQRNGWDLEFGRPLSRHVRVSVHTLYEDVNYPYASETDQFRRGVGGSIAYDTRDYVQNPTQGDLYVARIDKLFTWFGGSLDSWKYGLSFEKFFPLEKPKKKFDPEDRVKQVLATRLLWDLAEGDVPETEEYYVGSDNTVRGYSRLFARGRMRWVGNLEYRYLFNDIFQGVLFYDLGWAGETKSDFENPSRFQTGRGLGVRINTPMGPIRLDWGWKEEAMFSDGYLHFSIGHAF